MVQTIKNMLIRKKADLISTVILNIFYILYLNFYNYFLPVKQKINGKVEDEFDIYNTIYYSLIFNLNVQILNTV